MRYCYCEAKVRSSSVSVVYAVRLRIFSKAALLKRGSMEPIEPPLDPPLLSARSLNPATAVIMKAVDTKRPHYLAVASLSVLGGNFVLPAKVRRVSVVRS